MDVKAELEQTLEEIEALIESAKQRNAQCGMNIYAMVDRNGAPLLSPLIVAKSQIQLELAKWEEEDGTSPLAQWEIDAATAVPHERDPILHFCPDLSGMDALCGIEDDEVHITWLRDSTTCFQCRNELAKEL